MVVCRTAWYVEAPLQRGFGGMHWMEGADPRCLTLVSFKCYYNHAIVWFQDARRTIV